MPSNADTIPKITLGVIAGNYTKLYDSNVNSTVIRSDATDDPDAGTRTLSANIRSSTGGIHPVAIKVWKDRSGRYSLSSPCKVDCNCATYVFRNNEPLDRYGAALRARYLDRPSKGGTKVNPGNVVTCCKHIYGYVSFLLRRGDVYR